MNQRLLQFLAAENLSQSQFADCIGVARASVSHIIAGRNKPGFDFIENMSRHFPSLNLEWLITGKGRMYKTADSPHNSQQIEEQSDAVDLFSDVQSLAPVAEPHQTPVLEPVRMAVIDSPAQKEPRRTISSNKQLQSTTNQKSITKIIVFFDDGSFQELQ